LSDGAKRLVNQVTVEVVDDAVEANDKTPGESVKG
jgi:hypothetical protein